MHDNKMGNYDYETSTHKEFAVVRGGIKALAWWVLLKSRRLNG